MKSLVTGASGLLGNNLVRLLLERGDEVRALSRSATTSRSLADLDVERVDADIRDEQAMLQAVHGIDGVVFHCAACVKIGWSDVDEHESVNVRGAVAVARAVMEAGIRMVHVSSINALGVGWWDRAADEEDFDSAITPCQYVISKRRADEKLEELVQLENADVVTVMPGYMLGPWDWKPSSGRMLLEVAAGRPPLTPVGGISLCDARDVARGAMLAGDKGKTGRRFILAGHNIPYREIWNKMAALTGRHAPRLPVGPFARTIGGRGADVIGWLRGQEGLVNSAAMDISRLPHFFSSQRAIDELAYRIRPVDEIIRDAWDWFVEYGYVKK